MGAIPFDMARNRQLHGADLETLRRRYPLEMSSLCLKPAQALASRGRSEKNQQLEGKLTTFIRRSRSGLPEADVRPHVDQSPMAQTGARGAISRRAGRIVAFHSGYGSIAAGVSEWRARGVATCRSYRLEPRGIDEPAGDLDGAPAANSGR